MKRVARKRICFVRYVNAGYPEKERKEIANQSTTLSMYTSMTLAVIQTRGLYEAFDAVISILTPPAHRHVWLE